MKQPRLLHGEHLPPRIAYQKLFGFLPPLPFSPGRGRPRTNPNALLRCFVYRCLRRLPTLSDLTFALAENPSLVEAVGFDPLKPLPSLERFSAWMRTTPNATLQRLRLTLVSQLLQTGAIRGETVALDSCPVPAPVRQNNLKTSVKDRFNKERFPPNDPQARLGVYRSYASPTRNIAYFWGYRNHVAVDYHSELPLTEQTHPANQHESRFAIPLLQSCAQQLSLPLRLVCADSAYNSEKILAFIFQQLAAQPVIAPNARYQPNPDFRVQGQNVICPANLEMAPRGRMTPKKTGITYKQFSCPLYYRKTTLQRYLICPANHPKFFSQKGCNFLLRLHPSWRSRIDSSSSDFATHYKKRTSVERLFSRLLALVMQQPTVRGLGAIRNHCTIAHIAVLLVATAAHHLGHPDKLAFVRSFVPNFLIDR